ncbi:hypothetical protein [Pseudoduganella sp. R-43]|uniref:hypothetical protein n=1 Tax=unclassified Pseudoduganella TaxID=2637179 RepID=UPI003CF9961B
MLRILPFLVLLLWSSIALAKDIFIHSHHPVSKRFAIFEDNETVAYLYLTKPGTQRPEKDAVAYSRVPPAPEVDWNVIGQTGEVPPLPRDVASSQALIRNPREQEFTFKWSSSGEAVALLRSGVPIAFAAASEKFGYSKAVSKSSHLANAWDQKRYDAIFGK